MIDTDETNIKHLKKCLRLLHVSLRAAEGTGYGPMVIDRIREAITQIHYSIKVIEGKV